MPKRSTASADDCALLNVVIYAPFPEIDRTANYECTFSVSQRAREIITAPSSLGLFRRGCPYGRQSQLGETIDIVDHQGKWLARGAYSPASQIRARVWTFDKDETIDIDFFVRRLQQAQQWRDWLAKRDGLDSYRLIAGESDGLPGVTIDRFGNFLVLQLLSAGAEYQRAALISALQTLFPECAIYDRSDVAVRKKEGMELTQGPVTGELPPALLPIEEHGMKLLVDIQGGHKTGYYLDQRDSRLATRQYVADKRVLNCFSYTGGFAVSALMGGCAR